MGWVGCVSYLGFWVLVWLGLLLWICTCGFRCGFVCFGGWLGFGFVCLVVFLVLGCSCYVLAVLWRLDMVWCWVSWVVVFWRLGVLVVRFCCDVCGFSLMDLLWFGLAFTL